MSKYYLEGALIAQQCLRQAELEGNKVLAAVYRRMLDDALRLYELSLVSWKA